MYCSLGNFKCEKCAFDIVSICVTLYISAICTQLNLEFKVYSIFFIRKCDAMDKMCQQQNLMINSTFIN